MLLFLPQHGWQGPLPWSVRAVVPGCGATTRLPSLCTGNFYYSSDSWFNAQGRLHSFSCSSSAIKDKQHITIWSYTLRTPLSINSADLL